MLTLHEVAVSLGSRILFEHVSFTVNAGECAGLVGPNGSGKTTLLRAIAGLMPPDAGRCLTGGDAVAYLAQDGVDGRQGPLREVFPSLFAAGPEAEIERLARAMADEPDDQRLAVLGEQYEQALARLSDADAGGAASLLDAAGLRALDPEEPVEHLSGGERTKLALAAVLAQAPDVLLLDEPSNHLDITGIAWLESALRAFPGAVLLVSHDRSLLDACAGSIIELDPKIARATVFAGAYSDYAAEKERLREVAWETYERQQREERRTREAISAVESRARHTENITINFHYRKRAKKVARHATVRKARLERDLASAAHVDRPDQQPAGPQGRFAAAERGSPRLVSADDLAIVVEGRPLISEAHFEIERGDRICLVGANGSGKTTLLRVILGELAPAAGTLNISRSATIGVLAQEGPTTGALAGLGPEVTPIDVVRGWAAMDHVEATNFLHWFFFTGDQIRTPVAQLSLGERQRLALAQFFLQPTDLLILDEPVNHLDLAAREAFEATLDTFEGAALVVTHDRYFIERWPETVYKIKDGRLVLA